MMTRIYGVSFPKQKELQEYITMIEEAKKRDHRKLGAELELFMFSDLVGAGLPIWLPKGAALRKQTFEDFLKKRANKKRLPASNNSTYWKERALYYFRSLG